MTYDPSAPPSETILDLLPRPPTYAAHGSRPLCPYARHCSAMHTPTRSPCSHDMMDRDRPLLSRDSILPPSVCACSTSGARSTSAITPCCISTCTTHTRSLASCRMCSLDRSTTCIVCLISHISFTYLYVRVLHLTVCMCQLRPRIRFRCHTLSHAFQCGRIAPAVLALNTHPNRHEALNYKQTFTSHVFHRPGQIAQSPSQTPSPFRSSL